MIDVAKAAKLIMTAVEKQVGANVKSVDCPDDVKVKAKATFNCSSPAPTARRATRSSRRSDDKGNISVAAPFLHTDEAEQSIQTQLRKRAKTATVICPEIIVVEEGRHVRLRGRRRRRQGEGHRRRRPTTRGNFTYKAG